MANSQSPVSDCHNVQPGMETSEGDLLPVSYKKIDFILYQMSKYNNDTHRLKAVMVLNNFWHWTGGISWYVHSTCNNSSIPCMARGASEKTFINYTALFYECKEAKDMLKRLIRHMIHHKNQYTGVMYKDDDTIMSWEIVNDAMPGENSDAFYAWARKIADYVKSLDSKHLVTIGSAGPYYDKNFRRLHEIDNVDYITFSIHPQRWGWNTSLQTMTSSVKEYMENITQITKIVRKPVVLNSFSYTRDGGGCSVNDTTVIRDIFFNYTLNLMIEYAKKKMIVGCFFWGWTDSREPRPECGYLWDVTKKDPIIGDATDESQGTYCVYGNDTTMVIIKDAAKELKQAVREEDTPPFLWLLYVIIPGVFLLIIIIFLIVSMRKLSPKKTVIANNDESKSLIEHKRE
eukprot:TRINITY_DN1166_c0_g1_i2.p1 TRINITY_DN1166_c0_g1~~TRINITY_DN1166_c0_g1_i2.p1  ORF type:complete len:402 (+),score=105.25 TRINITY_DN1166_c0_g1_i2:355-1560(+)